MLIIGSVSPLVALGSGIALHFIEQAVRPSPFTLANTGIGGFMGYAMSHDSPKQGPMQDQVRNDILNSMGALNFRLNAAEVCRYLKYGMFMVAAVGEISYCLGYKY
jgi:hypothetical protein